MRCKTCHYSLENLTKRRCPECGHVFDPNDPKTYKWSRWAFVATCYDWMYRRLKSGSALLVGVLVPIAILLAPWLWLLLFVD